MENWLPLLFVIFVMLLGAVVVALLSATALVGVPRRWWRVVTFVSLLALSLNLVFSLMEAKQHNMLKRDVVAWVLLAGISPLLVGAVSRGAARFTQKVWVRTAAAALVVAALAGAAPVIMLVVHCTSGDCL